MRRIELGDFLLIAEIHCSIDASQLARIPRVISLAEAALGAPFAGFGEHELFPAIHEKAAVYCARIATYHPLPDGNKRAAYESQVQAGFWRRLYAAVSSGSSSCSIFFLG
jgi:death-on-curing protein